MISILCRLRQQVWLLCCAVSIINLTALLGRVLQQVFLPWYVVSISKCVFYAVPSISKSDFYAVHLYQQVWLLCCASLSASITSIANERSTWREKERERKRKGKEKEGKEKGKGKLEVKLWQKRKNRKRPSRESNPEPQQTRLMLYHWATETSDITSQFVLKFYPLCLHFTT